MKFTTLKAAVLATATSALAVLSSAANAVEIEYWQYFFDARVAAMERRARAPHGRARAMRINRENLLALALLLFEGVQMASFAFDPKVGWARRRCLVVGPNYSLPARHTSPSCGRMPPSLGTMSGRRLRVCSFLGARTQRRRRR